MYIQPATTSADLYSVFQGKKENLRSYLERFKAIVAKVVVTDDVAIPALRNGLCEESTFKDDLHINISLKLEDALHRANKFAEVEDRRSRVRNQTPAKDSHVEKVVYKEREPQQQFKKNFVRENNRANMFNVNSPQQPAIQRPMGPYPQGPMGPYPQGPTGPYPSRNAYQPAPNAPYPSRNANTNAPGMQVYCEYHQSNGHSTSQCYQLQRFLMEKYHRGKPNMRDNQPGYREQGKAIAESSKRSDGPQKEPNSPRDAPAPPPKRPYNANTNQLPPPRKRINMIMGGLMECKDSVRSIKAYEREAGKLRTIEVLTRKTSRQGGILPRTFLSRRRM